MNTVMKNILIRLMNQNYDPLWQEKYLDLYFDTIIKLNNNIEENSLDYYQKKFGVFVENMEKVKANDETKINRFFLMNDEEFLEK